ncbi:MAG TPA: site-2 protease family protein, partial [Hyphomicrobiales bacterium]|nr:site-2 protease family protein [Hyphomicrobiales bacterium]
HAVMARSFGLPIGGITLFIFGGVAELRHEPKTPRSEFWVAIVGPIASIAIAACCYFAAIGADALRIAPLEAVLLFLALINTVLALFNLVPAFPLDGGRILRSILWWRMGNLRRATRIAAMCGSIFGVVLVVLGLFQIFSGNAMAGTWQILIGVFLAAAASQARGQTEAAENLKGVSVADLMDRAPLTVIPDITVDVLVSDYIYRLNRKFIIVAEEGRALGYIGPEQVRRVPQSQWHETYVRAIAANFTHDTVVQPSSPAIEALRKIRTNGIGNVAVLDGSALAGTVSEANFVNYLSVREALAAPLAPSSREAAASGR